MDRNRHLGAWLALLGLAVLVAATRFSHAWMLPTGASLATVLVGSGAWFHRRATRDDLADRAAALARLARTFR